MRFFLFFLVAFASRAQEFEVYTYPERDHTPKERMAHLGGMYLASLFFYPLTQPVMVREHGSFKNYRDNFGKLVFDQDEPLWNWIVHPLGGSQFYLYYRAHGYRPIDSVTMSFISSALFEFTIEIYTEPASVQDLYQTPVLGGLLGVGLENISLYLLNSGNAFYKFLGHTLNPATLLWFYEGRLRLTPYLEESRRGFFFQMDF